MSKKLLLADDSVTIQRVIQLTFADEDIDVIAVGDGRQAIERLDRDPPDIVLADVGMPQGDGYEVAGYIKSTPRLSHIPVILLAGAFDPVDEARAKAIGCDGVLAKPFEPQQVIARVWQLLGGAKGAPDSAGARPRTEPPASTGKMPAGFAFQPAAPGEPPAVPKSLDEYFDRLDQNLTAASATTAAQPTPVAAPPKPPPVDYGWLPETAKPLAPPPAPAAGDWRFAAPEPAAPAPTIPREWLPSADADRPSTLPSEMPTEQIPRPAPATFAGPPEAPAAPTPSIADAFAALLAAEQGAPPPPPFAAPPLSDEMIDLIVSRVLDRMADDTMSDVVTRVAERLVREEIEKIKNAR